MKKNMGNTDKIIRATVGIIFAALFFANVISGVVGIVLLIIAVILVATSVFSFCPLYAALGISTAPKENQ